MRKFKLLLKLTAMVTFLVRVVQHLWRLCKIVVSTIYHFTVHALELAFYTIPNDWMDKTYPKSDVCWEQAITVMIGSIVISFIPGLIWVSLTMKCIAFLRLMQVVYGKPVTFIA